MLHTSHVHFLRLSFSMKKSHEMSFTGNVEQLVCGFLPVSVLTVSRKGSLTLIRPLTFRNLLCFNLSSANTHTRTRTPWDHTNTQASCSDMLHMLVLYFSSSQRPGLNSTEGRAHKTEAMEYYKQTHKCSPTPRWSLFFPSFAVHVAGCWVVLYTKTGRKNKSNLFSSPRYELFSRTFRAFQTQIFSLDVPKGNCRQKTKRGAIGFPTFHSVLMSEHLREVHVCIWASCRC